eukprot:20022-Heterococcus_DN1.PRE.2
MLMPLLKGHKSSSSSDYGREAVERQRRRKPGVHCGSVEVEVRNSDQATKANRGSDTCLLLVCRGE